MAPAQGWLIALIFLIYHNPLFLMSLITRVFFSDSLAKLQTGNLVLTTELKTLIGHRKG